MAEPDPQTIEVLVGLLRLALEGNTDLSVMIEYTGMKIHVRLEITNA